MFRVEQRYLVDGGACSIARSTAGAWCTATRIESAARQHDAPKDGAARLRHRTRPRARRSAGASCSRWARAPQHRRSDRARRRGRASRRSRTLLSRVDGRALRMATTARRAGCSAPTTPSRTPVRHGQRPVQLRARRMGPRVRDGALLAAPDRLRRVLRRRRLRAVVRVRRHGCCEATDRRRRRDHRADHVGDRPADQAASRTGDRHRPRDTEARGR